ncbi:hypothetical protein H6P81_001764 [Aristolochia fimbriata]|uniref:Fatty acyl-CoA reductase n=1 Tax=Aristolochia fimbriata TaxID=158543 RepID=A0AAV7FB14_ARIFI|nr:hypothetical protein H6P81_001764 [Aristolochia fimbriata]
MESQSVVDYLHGRSILVTGSTGFLAKMFVEKVLRVQPHVKKIYLLLRAPDEAAAAQRMKIQVLSTDLFKVLREAHGPSFKSFISEKVSPVAGNIAHENMGIDDTCVKEQLKNELDVIVHSAASTNFDERYDVALRTNTFGAKNVVDFAKKCVKLRMLLHVSTAYVAGEKGGIIPERPFRMGESLNGIYTIDIYQEMKLVDDKIKELDDQGATEERKATFMKEMGLQRARSFGWSNTYVFTKAMGEMLLGHLKGHLPLVIVRPAIVTATYIDPFPGWIENPRTMDILLVQYALGKLQCFLGDPMSVLDVIPGDMVVNAMIMLLHPHEFHHSSAYIFHLCSSMRKPPTIYNFVDCSYRYLSKYPHIGNNGKPIKVKPLLLKKNMSSFKRFINLHYELPLQVFDIINRASCNLYEEKCTKLHKLCNYAIRMALIYQPYCLFKGRFDDLNTKSLREASQRDSTKTFYYSIEDINWDSYFMNVQIPSVIKYIK